MKIITTDFCKIYMHDYYIIVMINEAEIVTATHNETLIKIIETDFKNKKFIYISHRINSYSIDPFAYQEASKIKNLVGFSVVTKDHQSINNTEVEKLFTTKPFEVFNSIDKATQWAESLIKSNIQIH